MKLPRNWTKCLRLLFKILMRSTSLCGTHQPTIRVLETASCKVIRQCAMDWLYYVREGLNFNPDHIMNTYGNHNKSRPILSDCTALTNRLNVIAYTVFTTPFFVACWVNVFLHMYSLLPPAPARDFPTLQSRSNRLLLSSRLLCFCNWRTSVKMHSLTLGNVFMVSSNTNRHFTCIFSSRSL